MSGASCVAGSRSRDSCSGNLATLPGGNFLHCNGEHILPTVLHMASIYCPLYCGKHICRVASIHIFFLILSLASTPLTTSYTAMQAYCTVASIPTALLCLGASPPLASTPPASLPGSIFLQWQAYLCIGKHTSGKHTYLLPHTFSGKSTHILKFHSPQ